MCARSTQRRCLKSTARDCWNRSLRSLRTNSKAARPATPGEERTVQYLIEEFKKYGLQPGGVDGGWVQPVPMVRAQVDGPVRAQLRQKGKQRALANGEDVTLQSLRPQDAVAIKNAPLVGALKAGSKATLDVIRDGKRKTLDLTVGAQCQTRGFGLAPVRGCGADAAY